MTGWWLVSLLSPPSSLPPCDGPVVWKSPLIGARAGEHELQRASAAHVAMRKWKTHED